MRQTRLISGLVMFAYVVCHFSNHAAGLISLDTMNAMLQFNTKFWMGPLGRPLLYTSLLVHFSLALSALYRRRSLQMSGMEWVQLVLGFSLPLLAAQHVVNTRIGNMVLGSNLNFSWEVYAYWVKDRMGGLLQEILMLSVWIHAMVGLHFRLKLKPYFPRIRLLLFALAILWPTLAALGFAEAGREVSALARDPSWIAATRIQTHAPTPELQAWLFSVRNAVWCGSLALLATILLGRRLRWRAHMRRGTVQMRYPGNRVVNVPVSTFVLEASRMARIPHASICGGRGRCSTCRIYVTGALDAIPPPGEEECHVLSRIGAPPNVRLACQLRPQGRVTVLPLLPPNASAQDGLVRVANNLQGTEREIAILFADIRGFTRLSENKLPYDVVFLLNRYFAEMGRAVEFAGGRVDKFIGDGVMALFGLNCDIQQASRQAVKAAIAMSKQLQELNEAFSNDLAEPLRIGIGLHSGTVIVGEMGYGRAISMTAIGDAVNTASRLEGHSKDCACELVVSSELAKHAGIDLSDYPLHEIEIRGRQGKLAVYTVPMAKLLAL